MADQKPLVLRFLSKIDYCYATNCIFLSFIVLYLIFISIQIISEESTRAAVISLAHKEVERIKTEILDSDDGEIKRKLEENLSIIKDIKTKASLIPIKGTSGERNVEYLMCVFLGGESENEFCKSEPSWFSKNKTEKNISFLVVFGGIVGAATGVFVDRHRKSRMRKWQTGVGVLTLGASAGFICYLTVKGGRSFFLLNTGVPETTFADPFAMAFAGVVVGLFAEDMYTWLEKRVTPEDGEGENASQ